LPSCKQVIEGREASAQAGLQVSRSTAYRLLRLVRTRGKVAFQDGRHGHPAKLRTNERVWLENYCHTSPGTPSRVVQTAFQERFGIQISIGYLNQVRARLGLARRTQEAGKKTRGILTD
jgi:transposase